MGTFPPGGKLRKLLESSKSWNPPVANAESGCGGYRTTTLLRYFNSIKNTGSEDFVSNVFMGLFTSVHVMPISVNESFHANPLQAERRGLLSSESCRKGLAQKGHYGNRALPQWRGLWSPLAWPGG